MYLDISAAKIHIFLTILPKYENVEAIYIYIYRLFRIVENLLIKNAHLAVLFSNFAPVKKESNLIISNNKFNLKQSL